MTTPLVVRLPLDEIKLRRLEIRELENEDRVITVIEVLSPTNKRHTQGRRKYERKLRKYRRSRVNTVEIDLLRGGPRVMTIPDDAIPAAARTDYLTCVRRRTRPDDFELYPMSLRERLPVIAIPLRRGDADVPIDLQLMLDQIFAVSRYGGSLYDKPPTPPFDADTAAWVESILASLRRGS